MYPLDFWLTISTSEPLMTMLDIYENLRAVANGLQEEGDALALEVSELKTEVDRLSTPPLISGPLASRKQQ